MKPAHRITRRGHARRCRRDRDRLDRHNQANTRTPHIRQGTRPSSRNPRPVNASRRSIKPDTRRGLHQGRDPDRQSEQRIARRQGRRHRAASVPALEPSADVAGHPLHSRAEAFRKASGTGQALPRDALPAPQAGAELWLACRFTDLPVEARLHDAQDVEPINSLAPFVVHDGHRRQPVIVGCNDSAREAGLVPGMRLGVAHTLVAGLQARERSEALEATTLEALATRALSFSSRVVIQAPDFLLIEIGASLRLFHSVDALIREYEDHFSRFRPCERGDSANSVRFEPVIPSSPDNTMPSRHRITVTVAPTPGAAELLCRYTGDNAPALAVTGLDQLRSVIASIPVSYLGLAERVHKTLRGMGVTHMVDLVRLPRDGLARRAGPDIVNLIDRINGKVADPRRHYIPADYFYTDITLTDDIVNIDQLLLISGKLADRLEESLLGKSCGVHQLHWVFEHHGHTSTRLTLSLSAPGQKADRFMSLMATRVENMRLSGPVHTVSLTTSRLEPLHMQALSLFPALVDDSSPAFDLIDRLRARLGDDRISCLTPLGEHRPEMAWGHQRPMLRQARHSGNRTSSSSVNATDRPLAAQHRKRPVWLLHQPRRLANPSGRTFSHAARQHDFCQPRSHHSKRTGSDSTGHQPGIPTDNSMSMANAPWLNGPINLIDGPERIETGWWIDGVRRDYYIGVSVSGRQLWLFHDIRKNQWYLQGIFV